MLFRSPTPNPEHQNVCQGCTSPAPQQCPKMRVQDQCRHGLPACSGPVAFSASPENRHGLSWIWPQGGCPSPVQSPTRGDRPREKAAPLAASPLSSRMEWARPSQRGHNHHLGGHVKPLEPHVALARWSVLGGGRHSGWQASGRPRPLTSRWITPRGSLPGEDSLRRELHVAVA